MYLKHTAHGFIVPPSTYIRQNDEVITGYSNAGNESMWLADGFLPVDESPRPEGDHRPVYAIGPNSIVQTWEALTPPVSTTPIVQYSKRRIRVALTARGLNEVFTSFLESSTELHQAWDDSVVLESTDPLFVQAMAAFCASAGITAPALQDILNESLAV